MRIFLDEISEVPGELYDKLIEDMFETNPEDWIGYDDSSEVGFEPTSSEF